MFTDLEFGTILLKDTVLLLESNVNLHIERNNIIKLQFLIRNQLSPRCHNLFKYWEYKLVRSAFLCIYFKTKWMNRSIKVLFIAAYFFPSFRQFSNSILKKWLVFGGDPILEPIFDFCERSELVTCCILWNNHNQKKQYPENTAGVIKHHIWAFSNIFLRL